LKLLFDQNLSYKLARGFSVEFPGSAHPLDLGLRPGPQPAHRRTPSPRPHRFEAIAISEVCALADQHPQAQIIMTADIDPERAKTIKHHYPPCT
jgi:hypothetical protein